jgi:G:T-mismatch repair DNA endonuclease (very short patch repair protein)
MVQNRDIRIRDRKNLEENKWNVITLWQCELKPKQKEERLSKFTQEIRGIFNSKI